MGSDKVIVVCEDIAQEKPIRAWLEELGYNSKHEVRFIPHAEAHLGKTRNNGWVERMFASHARQQRSRVTRMQCSLVICTDADEKPVSTVEGLLEARLVADSQPMRSPNENVALLIPKRHIETWLAFLVGEHVNEKTEYKNTMKRLDESVASKTFALVASSKAPRLPTEPPSLQQALDNECPRIPKR